jgi:hypothetical protein
MASKWPQSLEDDIRRIYYVEGKSASVTSALLGGIVTAGAIIGGANRRGWTKAADQSEAGRLNHQPSGACAAVARASAADPAPIVRVPLPPPRAPGPLSVPFADLPPGACTFPVGMDPGPGFVRAQLFCGERRKHLNYCGEHQRVAYPRKAT